MEISKITTKDLKRVLKNPNMRKTNVNNHKISKNHNLLKNSSMNKSKIKSRISLNPHIKELRLLEDPKLANPKPEA